jgi:prepilin-type N-terminal cleavage/methylation domain-containing protein/prepilin-type processing-associated H-X9-DG protein
MNPKPTLTFKTRYSIFDIGYSIKFGFTLVELLVVIAIIALLLSILTPSLMKAKSAAMRVKCAHNLKQIYLAMNLYLNAYDNTYPSDANDPLYTDPATGKKIWLWTGRGWRKFVEPYLGGNIDVNNPSVLFCPQDQVAKQIYESTSYAYSMAFYHSPEQIDTMTTTEKHTEQWDTPVPSIPQRSSDVARPYAKILIGEWECNHLRIEQEDKWWCKGWWSWNGSRNYLFADGQVSFLKAEQIRKARDGCPNPNMTIHGIKGLDGPR